MAINGFRMLGILPATHHGYRFQIFQHWARPEPTSSGQLCASPTVRHVLVVDAIKQALLDCPCLKKNTTKRVKNKGLWINDLFLSLAVVLSGALTSVAWIAVLSAAG